MSLEFWYELLILVTVTGLVLTAFYLNHKINMVLPILEYHQKALKQCNELLKNRSTHD